MDVEKAFDAVWHNGLPKKLHDMELPSDILRIISSFLTDRTIQVKIGNTLSEVVQLLAGTPQGSILSPLLLIEAMRYSIYPSFRTTWNSAEPKHFADIKTQNSSITWKILYKPYKNNNTKRKNTKRKTSVS